MYTITCILYHGYQANTWHRNLRFYDWLRYPPINMEFGGILWLVHVIFDHNPLLCLISIVTLIILIIYFSFIIITLCLNQILVFEYRCHHHQHLHIYF